MRVGKYEEYTFKLTGAIQSVFDEDSDNFIADLDDIDATVLFTAMLGAITYTFNSLTDNDKNLISMTHVLNSLAVQHVVNKAKEGE